VVYTLQSDKNSKNSIWVHYFLSGKLYMDLNIFSQYGLNGYKKELDFDFKKYNFPKCQNGPIKRHFKNWKFNLIVKNRRIILKLFKWLVYIFDIFIRFCVFWDPWNA
jgi:hypothetical protein